MRRLERRLVEHLLQTDRTRRSNVRSTSSPSCVALRSAAAPRPGRCRRPQPDCMGLACDAARTWDCCPSSSANATARCTRARAAQICLRTSDGPSLSLVLVDRHRSCPALRAREFDRDPQQVCSRIPNGKGTDTGATSERATHEVHADRPTDRPDESLLPEGRVSQMNPWEEMIPQGPVLPTARRRK